MQQRHIDRYSYFNELAITSRDFYIDYLEKFVAIKRGMNILEIGCGEGGNLLPFAEKECNVTGIDRSEERISQAISYFNLLGFNGRFIHSDFFDFLLEVDFFVVFSLLFLSSLSLSSFLVVVEAFLVPFTTIVGDIA